MVTCSSPAQTQDIYEVGIRQCWEGDGVGGRGRGGEAQQAVAMPNMVVRLGMCIKLSSLDKVGWSGPYTLAV